MPHVQTGLEVRGAQVSAGQRRCDGAIRTAATEGETRFDASQADGDHAATAARMVGNAGGKAGAPTSVARKVSTRLKCRMSKVMKKARAPKGLAKYYFQRYRLFHRFDEGVILDEQSWYSVTPEKIAEHIAQRYEGRQLIVDLYGGAGGNSIQFALHGAFVLCVERDERRIEAARHNARIYGVEQYMEFIGADVMQVLRMLRSGRVVVDGIFMSPPWGGPQYAGGGRYDVEVFRGVVEEARSVTNDVAILLPRTVAEEDVLRTFGACELERNYLGGRQKTVTVYFGGLVVGGGRR